MHDEHEHDDPPWSREGTSREAAEAMATKAGRQAKRVLDYIDSQGMHGATCDECEVALELLNQSGTARMRKLEDLGLVVTTARRRTTRWGRSAYVRVSKANYDGEPLAPARKNRQVQVLVEEAQRLTEERDQARHQVDALQAVVASLKRQLATHRSGMRELDDDDPQLGLYD